jgi:hypothetical protein
MHLMSTIIRLQFTASLLQQYLAVLLSDVISLSGQLPGRTDDESYWPLIADHRHSDLLLEHMKHGIVLLLEHMKHGIVLLLEHMKHGIVLLLEHMKNGIVT